MRRHGRSLLLAALLLPAVSAGQAQAELPAEREPRPFCRFVEEDGGGRLEVLVATYRRKDVTVTLHASLHVADREHYETLQQRFRAFDALLYELIADEDLRPHRGMEYEEDWLSLLQGGMAQGLGLADQLDCLDYRPANFVHADLTDEELSAVYDETGSDLLADLLSAELPEVDREAERRQRIDVVAALRSGRSAHALRVILARVLAEPTPPGEATLLIEGRNERCLHVLQQQLAKGRRRIGVYYGAAHMEHLERRLVDDLGFVHTREEWLVAWDCREERAPVVERGLQRKRWRARRDLAALLESIELWCEANPDGSPSWEALRQTQPDGRLPGRADGVDPWGRAYLLRSVDGGYELLCLGSDGLPDTDDDLALQLERGSR